MMRRALRVAPTGEISDAVLDRFVRVPRFPTLPVADLRVGVILSGGPAPGGHQVIAALFDGHPEYLVGFLGGPKGLLTNKFKRLDESDIAPIRDAGGFYLLGTGRDKIRTLEEFEAAAATVRQHSLTALIIIGGDDSNTNALALASYFYSHALTTRVIGVPKTIDGDLRAPLLPISFGFHTASCLYAQLVRNLQDDARSCGKYWHFVRIMGRDASHLTLEVATQVHPDVTLLSEEARACNFHLSAIVHLLCQRISQRAAVGRNYGVVLIPEGLPEALYDLKDLINLLNDPLVDSNERRVYDTAGMRDWRGEAAVTRRSLPASFIEQLQGTRDSFGNVSLSTIEMERLLATLVSRQLKETVPQFQVRTHFYGYEGRCAPPTPFDAQYATALGTTALHAAAAGYTGHVVSITNPSQPISEWEPAVTPLITMIDPERMAIKKTLLDMDTIAYFRSAEDRGPEFTRTTPHPNVLTHWE